jgi:dipeptidyl-peptidase-3
MRTLLKANGFMTLTWLDQDNLVISIDESKLEQYARPAISALMMQLHVYHCTADRVAGLKLFGELTEVDEEWLKVRDIVMEKVENEAPRVFVQANTVLEADGNVKLVEYEATAEGVIRSWVDRQL